MDDKTIFDKSMCHILMLSCDVFCLFFCIQFFTRFNVHNEPVTDQRMQCMHAVRTQVAGNEYSQAHKFNQA